jgi:hypothetical protein
MGQGSRAVLPRAAASPAALEYDSGMTENKRSRGLVVALVVLVLLAGVSLLTLLLNRDDDGAGQAAPPVGTTSAQPTASSSAPAEALPPLTTAPTGVTWELFRGVALPTSRTDGPTRVAGPVHAGFSRTPTGALLADAQISARALVDTSLPALRQVAEAQLVDGAGKTAYLNLLGQLRENDPPAGGYAQIAGFRYITYTPDLAVISRAAQDKSGRLQASTDTVRWVDGDWKLEKPATGLQQAQLIQNLNGYVPWSGVS